MKAKRTIIRIYLTESENEQKWEATVDMNLTNVQKAALANMIVTIGEKVFEEELTQTNSTS